MVQRELSREELRWLYAASDAFVLPTRGEGWCLPAMEAMSMALPVILTNASGTTEYLTRKNSLPLGFTKTHADGKVGATAVTCSFVWLFALGSWSFRSCLPVTAFIAHTRAMYVARTDRWNLMFTS